LTLNVPETIVKGLQCEGCPNNVPYLTFTVIFCSELRHWFIETEYLTFTVCIVQSFVIGLLKQNI